ncbi:HlyD family secretion protein [Pseudohalioglobus sediminis]|uniref:HlyD family secretion protein n=1 Tax=Pseudohalioglobus sediminis TaxID=2606449 RepID=A0A5B0WPC3_9GAMM|nr:HlyD family secretion protein [Pseudohalioglobus sediminis]KAA1188437.1 HlyD family secretion protein [Pseudohalioglobus sediminis]
MNEAKAETETGDGATQSQDTQGQAPAAVRRGGVVIAALILLSLAWYLSADRFTPYTTQARVQAYVVGIAPQVSGYVVEVNVKNNQRVEAGQQLFRIDTTQYEIALAKAQSDYENTLRQVDAGDAGVEAARANLRSAQANLVKAQKDTARLERLYKEDPGTISMRRLEISRATLDQSRAAVAAAEAGIAQAIEAKGGDSDDDNNTLLKIARTAVEKAQLDLERTVVRATSAGVITDLRTDVGMYAAAGGPLMTMVSFSDVWVQADFTENNLGNIQTGTPVEILFDVLPGQVFAGEISNIGLGISASQPPPPGTLPSVSNNRDWLRQSQRFPVIVRFPVRDDDALLSQLRVGGQASVIAYSDKAWLTRWLGKLYIRFMSVMTYAY